LLQIEVGELLLDQMACGTLWDERDRRGKRSRKSAFPMDGSRDDGGEKRAGKL
jgi:hypothetical protein